MRHYYINGLAIMSMIAWWFALYEYSWASNITPPPLAQQAFNTVQFLAATHPYQKPDNLLLMNDFVQWVDLWSDVWSSLPTHDDIHDTIYDTLSDNSITKYVSKQVSLHNISYKPSDLITIQSKYLTTNKAWHQLRKEAYQALELLAEEFTDIFNKKLVVVSSYRSYDYQKNLKKKWCPDTLCAPAGHSEHQLGLAVDLFAATTADQFLSKADFAQYYKRLASNAHRYGRHNTYQKWVDIDTYQVEPRHRRYVGRELATELYDKKMTFGEWIKTTHNKVEM